MEQIIAFARQLGNRIAEHSRTRAFSDAGKAVSGDAAARQIMMDYQSHVAKLREAEAAGQTIGEEDRRRLAELESKMAVNDLLKALMRSQADYLELMHRVNEAIDRGSQEGL